VPGAPGGPGTWRKITTAARLARSFIRVVGHGSRCQATDEQVVGHPGVVEETSLNNSARHLDQRPDVDAGLVHGDAK
jgi:hypothetical protein